jgi:hypothetical protein
MRALEINDIEAWFALAIGRLPVGRSNYGAKIDGCHARIL